MNTHKVKFDQCNGLIYLAHPDGTVERISKEKLDEMIRANLNYKFVFSIEKGDAE